MTDKIKTRQMMELLRCRHPAPEWATFAELNIGTGSRGGRWIDFYAMNLYPSNGNLKIAYEVKASRADFTKEMSDPTKREPTEGLADECYFVAPHGMLAIDEIPDGWGLVVMNAGGLKCVKKARQKRITELPVSFVMSLARRTTDAPSPLPPSVWLYAGKEIPESELRHLADEATRLAVDKAEVAVRKEVENSDRIKRLKELRDVVIECLGHGYDNPQRLKEYLEGMIKPIPAWVSSRLINARREIEDALKGLRDSGQVR